MFDLPSGRYVRAYLATNDAFTAALALTLKDYDGNTVKIQPGQRIAVIDFIASGGAAGIITLFQDQDGGGTVTSGEELIGLNFAVAQPSAFPNATGAVVSAKVPAGSTGTKGQLFVQTGAAVANTRVVLVGIILDT